MTERWAEIPGWEGYYSVSDCGRVRGEPRNVVRSDGVIQRRRGLLLTPTVCNPRSGHLVVHLSRNARGRSILLHKLVLAAFIGPCPPGMQGLHWDDNPRNNNLSNLRYGTHSQNMLDKVRNGGHHQTRKTKCPQGHEYTPPNTLVSSGKRRCRACIADQAPAANARRRAAAAKVRAAA